MRIVEFVLVVVLAALVYALSARYDLLERFALFSRRHEHWQLDEILVMLGSLAVAMTALALMRWLEARLAEQRARRRLDELMKAQEEIRRLEGIIPICASCKKIRDDKGAWHQMEAYIRKHSEAEFSHGFCPECMKEYLGDLEEEDASSEVHGTA